MRGIFPSTLVAVTGSLCVLFAFPAGGWAAAGEPDAGKAKRNVLFIMADDLRTELGSYGSRALTPNLDRLAASSVQFNRMYTQQAVCNPSRSSMLTGRRPDSLQLWSNGLHFRERNPEVETLPGWFKANGYTTRCVGKIFHNWHTEVQGDARAWSAPEFLHYANHGDDRAEGAEGLVNHSTVEDRRYGGMRLCEALDVPDEAYYDGRVAREAVRVLGEVKDAPFFLAVGFWKPHAPFNAPKKYWDLYDPQAFKAFDGRRPVGAPEEAFHQSTEILGPPAKAKVPSSDEAAEMRRGYFANISFLDAQVGKVLDALERSGKAESTLVVFLSDHGYHLGEHTLWGKTSNFELDARVPCYVRVPGVTKRGERTDSLTELVDVFPTVARAAGIGLPSGLDGVDLSPVLRDASVRLKDAAFTQHPRPAYFDRQPPRVPKVMGMSVRTEAVRYTEWRDWASGAVVGAELYDAKGDVGETRNVIADEAWKDRLADARRRLATQFGPR
ncbi:MAG: hypothetical protein RIS92_332 [Verrucomicrobiota bacterium]|jgi:iduronate 2-sulfatase